MAMADGTNLGKDGLFIAFTFQAQVCRSAIDASRTSAKCRCGDKGVSLIFGQPGRSEFGSAAMPLGSSSVQQQRSRAFQIAAHVLDEFGRVHAIDHPVVKRA